MVHPIRIKIRFRPATPEQTAKALGMTRAEIKVANELVQRYLERTKKARKRRTGNSHPRKKTA